MLLLFDSLLPLFRLALKLAALTLLGNWFTVLLIFARSPDFTFIAIAKQKDLVFARVF
jgi:hypothetical protein